ncbi:hypothetical protein C0993_010950 [Termitomyces sp. T159_Od127]|nr:hypothetical protein C0993_010950 [Termitomyces sp. T159_Od127]
MSITQHADDAEKGVFDKHEYPIVITLSGSTTSHSDDSNDTHKKQVVKATIPAPVPPPSTKKPAPHKANIWIRAQLWFNTYRKFFTFTVSLNIVGIVLAAAGKWQYPRYYSGPCLLGNLLVAILMRNELFGRFLYLLVNTLFAKWTPLWFRLGCTSVLQHLGGIHSGCAISGFMWLVFRVVWIFVHHKTTHTSILVFGLITLLIILVSIMSALPWVRNTHHNVFERHHRFMGWSGLLSTWIFVILGDSWDTNTRSWNPNGIHIVHQQDFWFILGMTVFVIIPWVTIREVKVDVEIPSPKVLIMRFERGMQQGLLARISRGSVIEYHAFGIISEGRHAKYHYLICGVQGDFTRNLVKNPPERIWTRELKFAGVSNTSTLYKRGIRSPDWYLIWIGSDQEKTFGPTISGLIHNNLGPERVTLWDSKQRGGRPDVMKLIKETYVSWRAEVIFITSNYQGNQEMMEGCKEAGIPAFVGLFNLVLFCD